MQHVIYKYPKAANIIMRRVVHHYKMLLSNPSIKDDFHSVIQPYICKLATNANKIKEQWRFGKYSIRKLVNFYHSVLNIVIYLHLNAKRTL